jgi:hypothetical protein
VIELELSLIVSGSDDTVGNFVSSSLVIVLTMVLDACVTFDSGINSESIILPQK